MRPLTAKILNTVNPLVADRRYEVVCESAGSRPPAIITWYKGKRQLKRTKVHHYFSKNTNPIYAHSKRSDNLISFAFAFQFYIKQSRFVRANSANYSTGLEFNCEQQSRTNFCTHFRETPTPQLPVSRKVREGAGVYEEFAIQLFCVNAPRIDLELKSLCDCMDIICSSG